MGLTELVTQLPELIGQAVEANQWLGYTAIFAAMFLENLFPPIPSELIMPLAGFYVQQGQMELLPVVLVGVLGTVIGALPWYGILNTRWPFGPSLSVYRFGRCFGTVSILVQSV